MMKRIQQKKRNSIFAYKKANSITDTILFIVFVVVVGLVGFFSYYIFSLMNTDLQTSDLLSNDAKTELQTMDTNMPDLMDGLFVLVVVGIWVAVIAFSYFIETSPLLYGIIIVFGVALVVVGIGLAEWATDIQNDADLIAYTTNMPLTFAVLTHFPIYVIIVFISALITLFAKEAA